MCDDGLFCPVFFSNSAVSNPWMRLGLCVDYFADENLGQAALVAHPVTECERRGYGLDQDSLKMLSLVFSVKSRLPWKK